MANRRGLLIIISSPSGAGKSTLSQRLRAWDPTIRFSVSATTRTPRKGESDGVDYFFVSRENFQSQVEEGAMLEHAEVFGNLYGSPKGPVQQAMNEGCDTLFDIDWQGGQQVRNSVLGRDVVSIFVLPPSISELEERLKNRGQDSEQVINTRMAKAHEEISHWAEYDYVIVNNDVDAAELELRTILSAERLRRDRRPDLTDFVRGLEREFLGEE